MLRHLIRTVTHLVVLFWSTGNGYAQSVDDLSPRHWPTAERIAAEQTEVAAPTPLARRVISGGWAGGRDGKLASIVEGAMLSTTGVGCSGTIVSPLK